MEALYDISDMEQRRADSYARSRGRSSKVAARKNRVLLPAPEKMLTWLDKFETSLAHCHNLYAKHKSELDLLRRTVKHQMAEYFRGPSLDDIIADMISA